MIRIGWIALSCLTASCAALGGERNPRLSDIHYRLGVNELYQGRAPKAIQELLLSLKHDPDNADAHYSLGFAYQGRRALEQALYHLKRAVELRPNFSDAYNNLGTVYLELDRPDEAISMFQKALGNMTYATPYLAYGNLGWAHFKKGDHATALRHLKTALFHNPKFCQAHNNVGVVYTRMGDHARAAEHLEIALKNCPKYVEAHYRLGISQLKLRRRDLASASFRSCETLAPESDWARECRRYLKVLP